jgi:hypothetical protein
MAIVEGTFTALEFLNVKADVNTLFKNNGIDAHINKPPVAFNELVQNQSFEVPAGPMAQVMIDGEMCNAIVAYWTADCDTTVDDDTDLNDDATDCDITGTRGGADSKTYTNNLRFHKDGQVNVTKCKDHEEAQAKLARQLATHSAVLDYELEKRMLAFLLANAQTINGDTTFTDQVATSTYPVATVWNIPAAKWEYSLIADFTIVSQKKQLVNPKVISGDLMYREKFLAPFKDGDGDQYATLMGPNRPMNLVNNIFDMEATTSQKSAFIVDNANIGYWNSSKFDESLTVMKDTNNTHVFSIRSNRLTWRNGNTLVPVRYDVRMQYKCIGDDQYAWVYRMRHDGGLVTGPGRCTAGYTGIIHVVQDYT